MFIKTQAPAVKHYTRSCELSYCPQNLQQPETTAEHHDTTSKFPQTLHCCQHIFIYNISIIAKFIRTQGMSQPCNIHSILISHILCPVKRKPIIYSVQSKENRSFDFTKQKDCQQIIIYKAYPILNSKFKTESTKPVAA